MAEHKILINGVWRVADAERYIQANNPTTGEAIAVDYPVSSWNDCDAALSAATGAWQQLQTLEREVIARFLEAYAERIEHNAPALVEMAHLETGLPTSPRLSDVELPRTTGQLRQAAQAARQASWTMPTIDTQNNIRSMLQGIGPVAVFGPNNFPFAFGSASGGDFAAAIAAGNPVIAKANSSHPGTTRLFAELAQQAAEQVGMPKATVQLIYATSRETGYKLVSDHRLGATGFTGSRNAGLALKKAADEAGRAIFLELSSVNPVLVLNGAAQNHGQTIIDEFTMSCTASAGQLCTKPGLLIVPTGQAGDSLVAAIADKFDCAPAGTLLGRYSAEQIAETAAKLQSIGAQRLTPQSELSRGRFCHPTTLLSVTGEQFIAQPQICQSEMFGNASLVIRSESIEQTAAIISQLEGNLTGTIYSDQSGLDDADYSVLERLLREKVGRLINDKMPTGVAVSSAMNHGGPFPSTGNAGVTAVGFPAASKRFGALKCFDNVREHRLPDVLRDKNPGEIWRLVDGQWTMADL